MALILRFSGAKTFEELMRMNERFYYALNSQKSPSFFVDSLFFIEGIPRTVKENQFHLAASSLQMHNKWRDIWQHKDKFPLLQFDSVVDGFSKKLEKVLDGIIRPVEDPFWDMYFPLNFPGDRSTIRLLSYGEVTKLPAGVPLPSVGYQRNLSKPFDLTEGDPAFVVHVNEYNLSFLKQYYAARVHTSGVRA